MKSVYFNNKTGSDAVGKNALAQLRKGGKFQLVADPKQADLIFILSADPYNGGNLIFASGQTGTIDDGHITEDPIPNYNKQSPTRYAYLTVIDPKTGGNLWSDQHSGAACPQVSTASAHVSSRNSKTKLRSKGEFGPLKTQETALAYLAVHPVAKRTSSRWVASSRRIAPSPDWITICASSTFAAAAWLEGSE